MKSKDSREISGMAAAKVVATAKATPEKSDATSEAEAATDSHPNYGQQVITTINDQQGPSPDRMVHPALGLKGVESDGEIVVLDILTNRYFRFNAEGTYLWKLVMQRLTVADMSEQMSKDFQITPERAQEIVTTFTAKLVRAGLAVLLTQTKP